MNVCKKLFSLMLALMLLISVVPAAMAAGATGSIQFTAAAQAGSGVETYKIYKMYDIETVHNTVREGRIYTIPAGTIWTEFTVPNVLSVNGNTVLWEAATVGASEGAVLSKAAVNYLNGHDEKNDVTKTGYAGEGTVGGAAVTVEGDAYYLVVAEKKITNENNEEETIYITGVVDVEAGETATVLDKTAAPGRPTVKKLVQEDSTNLYDKRNDADIGQILNYQIIITAGENATNYVLHDKMDSHIEYEAFGYITRDGNLIESAGNYKVYDEDSDYTGDPDAPKCSEGCRFHVKFNEEMLQTVNKGAPFVVHYTAKLKADATSNVDHTNTAWLTYGRAVQVESNFDSTHTKTYTVTAQKVDQDTKPLPNAGFVLEDNAGKRYYKADNGPVIWLEKATNDNGEEIWKIPGTDTVLDPTVKRSSKSDDPSKDCVIEFEGVDSENFKLIEVEVPGGYTGATATTVNPLVAPKGVETASGEQNTQKILQITNVLGTALPETGGMGTTLFYVIGGLMAAGAAILLVTKKRMGA